MERVFVMHYIVQSGDSLYNVAMQYHTTVRHLIELNPQISNPNRIYVGDRIEVGKQWVFNPWRGNEWKMGMEEYQRGIEEIRRGRAEYRRGRKKSSRH